jgi:TolB-like protein
VEAQRVQRRLAAILAADVAGYSRLIGVDEEGTIARLRALRRELIGPSIDAHDGRIVKTTGDGILVEFGSVVDAVRCAIQVQRGTASRNHNVPVNRRIELRVGINLGDVVVEGDDLLGNGVNVAARLENIAEPGGICVSEDAYRQARDKVDATFFDLGEQRLKNITRPIRVFRVETGADWRPTQTRASLPLPEKASIAVLPFQNMSGDPEQEYFADGIVEEIITALSRIRWLFVIARNSSFTYKGQSVDIKQIGRELGVLYVLEGSVRKAGNRMRITGQLIDVTSGAHLWADRFDGSLEDVFMKHFETFTRLSPRENRAGPLLGIGVCHFFNRNLEEARTLLLGSLQENRTWAPTYRFLASCCAHMGRLEEARDIVRRLREITPVVIPSADHWRNPEHREFYLQGLRMAAGD